MFSGISRSPRITGFQPVRVENSHGLEARDTMEQMPDTHSLEYAFPLPVQPLDDWRTTLSRALAFGYVAASILGLLLMGTLMALKV